MTVGLLMGDSLAAGAKWAGAEMPAGVLPPPPEVFARGAWSAGDPWQSAHTVDGVGLFGVWLGFDRLYTACTPGQGIANLTADNSTVWRDLEASIDAAGIRPSVGVLWHGANDAGMGVTVEAYRLNLHVLHDKAEALGCKRVCVVQPITAVGGASLANVREATWRFADDVGQAVDVVDLDGLLLPDYLEVGGPHMSELGFMAAGRMTYEAIHWAPHRPRFSCPGAR